MKKKIFGILFFVVLIAWFCFHRVKGSNSFRLIPNVAISGSFPFELRKGDILVRPNWGWLPGSCSVPNGRKYGHVAIVTNNVTGETIDEVLEKATVVEALFFDQRTREFQFDKKDQIRETKAGFSFGSRFKNIRYRLRLSLTDEQADLLICFLRNQLNGGYNIFSQKKYFESKAEKIQGLKKLKDQDWHCASLVWEAFYLVIGIDLDSNKGFFIYPSDIIAHEVFDLPDGRVRF